MILRDWNGSCTAAIESVAAKTTGGLGAAARTNPNVRLVEYAIRLELSPKERTDGD